MHPGVFGRVPEGRKRICFRLLGLTLFFHLHSSKKTQPQELPAVRMPFNGT